MIDRNQKILQYLLVENIVEEQKLLQELNLTARQLHYAIEGINDTLVSLGYSQIVKKGGNFYYPSQTKNILYNHYFLSYQQLPRDARLRIILLLILSKDDYISLDHFVYVFSLSKNTIVNELKKCKRYLLNYQLILTYRRNTGYEIEGEEWSKRRVLNHIIYDLIQNYGNDFLIHLLSEMTSELNEIEHSLRQIERFLEIKYTDEDYYQLVPFLAIVLKRIRQGQVIQSVAMKDVAEIRATREYQSLLYSSSFEELPEKEYLYISLHLLGSKVSIHAPLTTEDLYDLSKALYDFLSEFERHAMLFFHDKDQLLEKLLNHFKPAYYRIKYHLTFENVMYEQITDKYRVLHDFVKQSIRPLENFFQTHISDKEIAYITIFIGGHLHEKGEQQFDDKTIKAVVVCPSGISFSKLMEQELTTLFPEFVFYPSISVREYQAFILPHQLVFSSVPIETEKPVYLVKALTMDDEKIRLRERVISQFFRIQERSIDIDKLMSVIKKHAHICSEIDLRQELTNYLLHDKPSNITSEHPLPDSITDVLTPDCIQFIAGQLSWEQLLTQLSKPLLIKKVIDPRYVKALIAEYRTKPEYIMLRGKLILPHLDPMIFKQQLGMSILVCRDGFLYQGQLLHLVVLLTTPDKMAHLPILLQLKQLANNESLLAELIRAESAEAFLDLLHH
ncbi:Transcriptional antiterminator [Streptococcus gallolyticus]|uniref:Ascorbate-specific PTS system EIIA component n=1 Tax=Streptococcus gallolyticus TaxID=315405 RepID=A0A1I7F2E9_9STRE|nr:BglG family transcription antiterminator [Streptococcus gallolyticus]SFC00654.1 Transcriptional antiterminator [Streptococcus gallolyticus]SFU30368.1 Transcriptional antiterminator [Streptococcus gallolyticus]